MDDETKALLHRLLDESSKLDLQKSSYMVDVFRDEMANIMLKIIFGDIQIDLYHLLPILTWDSDLAMHLVVLYLKEDSLWICQILKQPKSITLNRVCSTVDIVIAPYASTSSVYNLFLLPVLYS